MNENLTKGFSALEETVDSLNQRETEEDVFLSVVRQDGNMEADYDDGCLRMDSEEGSSVPDQPERLDFLGRRNIATVPESAVGPPFSDNLADLINKSFKGPISNEKADEFSKKHARPEGVDWLQVPTVPECVWRKLPGDFLGPDKALQSCQGAICTMITAMSPRSL